VVLVAVAEMGAEFEDGFVPWQVEQSRLSQHVTQRLIRGRTLPPFGADFSWMPVGELATQIWLI
jgi:hypothetical protein